MWMVVLNPEVSSPHGPAWLTPCSSDHKFLNVLICSTLKLCSGLKKNFFLDIVSTRPDLDSVFILTVRIPKLYYRNPRCQS